ncbi:glycosyltransferase family 9 protein, partial [Erwinia amylovora]|nr:glycosyltransferase family 9 protein [Erwinia amylovora]
MTKNLKINITNWFQKKNNSKHARLENNENYHPTIKIQNIVIKTTTTHGDKINKTPANRAKR